MADVVDDLGVTVVGLTRSFELCPDALEQEDAIIKKQQEQIK